MGCCNKIKRNVIIKKKDFDVVKVINIYNVIWKFNIGDYIKKVLFFWYYSRGIK